MPKKNSQVSDRLLVFAREHRNELTIFGLIYPLNAKLTL